MDAEIPSDNQGTWNGQLGLEKDSIPAEMDVRVDVYVRSMAPPPATHEAQVGLIADLEALAAADVVDESTVTIWGERLCRCETCRETGAGRAVLARVRSFEGWAADVDATVDLPFDFRRLDCEMTGASNEVIVPPRVTLGIHVEGTLRGVFPCVIDGVSISASDGLAMLRRARRSGRAADGRQEELPATSR